MAGHDSDKATNLLVGSHPAFIVSISFFSQKIEYPGPIPRTLLSYKPPLIDLVWTVADVQSSVRRFSSLWVRRKNNFHHNTDWRINKVLFPSTWNLNENKLVISEISVVSMNLFYRCIVIYIIKIQFNLTKFPRQLSHLLFSHRPY